MNERGYQVVPGYLKETAGLRSVLQARLDEYQPNEAEQSRLDRYLLHDLICRDFIFCLLLDDRRLQGLLSPVLGDNWILYAATSSSLPPSSTNYARRIHRDSAGSHPGRVGAIFALDDFTARTGATEVLPGSHLEHGVDEEAFNRDCEPIECEAGSLILFDARLYHRAGINQTASWRHAMTMNFCMPWMKQRMDWPRMVPTEFVSRLGEQGKRAVGMHSRVPASMGEFWNRTYKANQV